jgi:hypothetical protein
MLSKNVEVPLREPQSAKASVFLIGSAQPPHQHLICKATNQSVGWPQHTAPWWELLTAMSRAMARKVMSSLKSLLKDSQRRGNVAQNVALAVKRIDADKRGEQRLKVRIRTSEWRNQNLLISLFKSTHILRNTQNSTPLSINRLAFDTE